MSIKRLFLLGILVTVAGLIAFEMTYAQTQELCEDKADSITLKVLSWREATSLNDLETGRNIDILPVDGFRAGTGNFSQRGPTGGKNPESGEPISITTDYPVKTQFIVVARVHAGVKEVVWNLSNAEADIIGVPQGSKFLDSSHVITPVGTSQVKIENVQYAIITQGMVITELEFPNDWRGKLDRAEHGEFPDFYNLQRSGGSTKRSEYMKSFRIADNESYIVITASRLGETDIVAYAAGSDPREASVYATVRWVEQPSPLKESEAPPSASSYDFVANVIGSPNPITVKGSDTLDFTISVTVGNNSAPIPTDLLAFRLEGDSPKGWWNSSNRLVIYEKFRPTGAPSTLLRNKTYTMNVSVTVPGTGYTKPFEVNNTELRFVGPVASNQETGYVVITNEAITVIPEAAPPKVSGLTSEFRSTKSDPVGTIALTNQGLGDIYEIYVGTNLLGDLSTGANRRSNVGATTEVNIKFKIRGVDEKTGKIVEEEQTVILRR